MKVKTPPIKVPKKNSIRTKILLVSMLIALGTTIASLLISYYAEIDTIKETTEKYMTQYISFADENFNNMLEDAGQITLSMAVEKDSLLPVTNTSCSEASYVDYRKKRQVGSFLSGLMNQKEYIDNIILVTEDKRIYQANTYLIMKKDLNEEVMGRALEVEKAGIIFNSQLEEVLFCRPIIAAGKKVAVSIVKLNYERLVSVYEVEALEGVDIYIYGSEGDLFYTNTDGGGDEKNLYEQVRESGTGSGYINWNGEKQYYIEYQEGIRSMTTISLIPYDSLLQDANELKNRFVLIGLMAVLFAVAAAVYLSKRLCADLHQLTDNMKEIQKGNLMVRSDISSQDEIGILAVSFNEMVERIRGLLEEVRLKEKLKREAEQDVLATQIEPHFLYNTIDSIQYVAHMREDAEIEQVAVSLSELLRSVLSNRNEFITLWEEREYIENYITIERFKYRGEFQLLWEVDENLWIWKIPKLLLQPIVENALIHGISEKETEGIIQIKIYRQEEDIIIKIMDNGRGMSREQIEQMMSEVTRKEKKGFRRVGFANVMNRIRLIYGEDYTGNVYSCEDMFTCVELRLPAEGGENGTFGFDCG